MIGTGDLQIDVSNGDSTTPVILRDTLYATDMELTIVLIRLITSTGHSVAFERRSCKIKNKVGKIIGNISASSNRLYKVKHSFTAASTNAALAEQVDIHTLHQCLGHIPVNAICSLVSRGMVTGICLIDNGSPIICDSCKYVKLTYKPIKSERSAPLASRFGDEIHSDVWGPSPTTSLRGCRYYVTFTDDHMHYTQIKIIKIKDQTLPSYHIFAT